MAFLVVTTLHCLVGFAVLWAAMRYAPALYFQWVEGRGDKPGRWERRAADYLDILPGSTDLFASVVFWPGTIFVVMGHLLMRGTRDALNDGIGMRAQMEKDLAAARREIDELLKRDGAV